MDFLNRALLQISDLFRSMTPGARIASALLLAVVLISVGYLFQSGVSGPDAYLMGGARFSASELPAMEAAFAKANLSAYEVQGNQIRVPRGQQAAYMGALADAGALPAHFGDYLMKAVNDSNPFLTGAQRDQRYKTAKQKELAEIIRNMPGIEKAAVMYDEQTRPGLRKEKTMTASVNVKPIGTQLLDESRIGMIRHLVAGAVAGLEPNRVTVIDQNGKAYAAGDSVTGAGLDNPYFETQRKWQLWIEESVHKALAYVPDLTVTASIELEKELEHSESSLKLDKQADAVAIKSIDSSKSTVDERAAQAAGRPGLEAQQPNQPANLAAGGGGGNRSSQDDTLTETENAIGHTTVKMRKHPLTPKKIMVAVGIPDSYFQKVWELRNPGQDPATVDPATLSKVQVEEETKIRKHVATVINKPEELSNAEPMVTVTSFAHLKPAEIASPSLATQALGWLGESYASMGMIGLALFSLLMLRSMVTSAAANAPLAAPQLAAGTIAGGGPAAVAGGGEAGGDGDANSANKLKRRIASGPSMQDELTDLVREDPDAAANILRGWIGKVG